LAGVAGRAAGNTAFRKRLADALDQTGDNSPLAQQLKTRLLEEPSAANEQTVRDLLQRSGLAGRK
jgi:hypothetical protein